MKVVCEKLMVVFVAALLTSSAYGAPGDVWDLQGDFSELDNPGTVTHPSGSSASWDYTHERMTLFGPVLDNFPSELPANFGWTTNDTPGHAHTSMNLFSESSADAGKSTNWLAGEVGGHSSTSYGVGAKWTTHNGGTFQVDVTGFHARRVNHLWDQELRLTDPGGLETWPISQHDNNGSANAVSASRVFTLIPNDVLRLEIKGPTWFGMTMRITELAQQEFFDYDWRGDGLGDWNLATNWLPSSGPPGSASSAHNANHTVVFGDAITGPTTVSVNEDVTLNHIEFDNTMHSYAVSGLASVNLVSSTEEPTADPTINVTGTHQFQAAVNLAANTSVVSNGTLDFNNEIALGGFTLTTSGNVNINHSTTGGGAVNSSGTLGTAGMTSIGGDLSSTGVLAIDLGSNNTDFFDVNGRATLSGMLDVELEPGFTPSGSFTVLTAGGNLSAAGLSLDPSDSGTFSLAVNANDVVLTALSSGGDFNGDGTVDAADYTVWQDNLGALDESALNGNGNGVNGIDQDDYILWKANFGSSGAGSGLANAVPEPAGLLLTLVGAIGLTFRGGRRRLPPISTSY
jgi:hypothetical protein